MWSSSAGRSNPAQIKFRNKCNSIPSLDKLLKVHIEKHTWQSLDRKYCCRNVVSCWKDHRVPSLISALVTWGVIAQQLLTVLILGAGQVLQTCSSQSSGSPEVTGSGTASGTRTVNPGASFPVPTQISRLRGISITSASTGCFWSRPWWIKHFSFPLWCWRTCRLIQAPSL